MTHKIVLVDDDQNILVSVTMALEAEGFEVSSYNNSEDALSALLKDPPDLAVLDIKMPRMTGLELLTELRKESNLPVIFLTSVDNEIDEVLGFRMGADDYITKPFSQRLLIERIHALLRRKSIIENSQENQKTSQKLTVHNLELDDERFLCCWKQNPVNLTVTEYLLLKALADKPGHVKTRDQLIDFAYGENIFVDDRTIDSHIKRVRQKFKKLDPEFNHIETLYGVGYKYKEDE